MSYRFLDSFRAGPGCSMTYTIAELSETCRVSCRNKFVKLVHLVGFITKKFVTMQYGHMNVKWVRIYICSWVAPLIQSTCKVVGSHSGQSVPIVPECLAFNMSVRMLITFYQSTRRNVGDFNFNSSSFSSDIPSPVNYNICVNKR